MHKAAISLWFMLGMAAFLRAEPVTIRSAQRWPDTSGVHINAHCGDVLFHAGTYYWFGENRLGARWQVTCFASTDLRNWTPRGIVLKQLGRETGFIERPKVIFNESTKKFVMWMHKEGAPGNYREARAAVATSDRPDGDYQYLGSFRPLENMSRDDYLFKDDDGTAYFISASNNNATLRLYRLTSDYLKIDQEIATLFPEQFREAPVIFKRNGIYYLLTSFASGMKSNPQYYSMAKSIGGPWTDNRPLCSRRTWNTYYSQGAFAFKVQGTRNTTYVFGLDRWVKPMRHVWLPLEFNADDTIKPLEWHDEWQIDAETGLVTIPPAPTPLPNNLAKGKSVTATYDSPGKMFDYGHFANHEPDLAVDGDPGTAWAPNDNLPHWIQVDLGRSTTISGVEAMFWKSGRFTYAMHASLDGHGWKTLIEKEMTESSKSVRDNFAAVEARYVRVSQLRAANGYNWPGVSELAVFADGKDVARGKPVTADDFQARTDATKAVDGDFSTAWTIDNEQLPQSLTVDLATPTVIGGVRILWESAGTAHQYKIEISTDGTAWTTNVDQTANTPETPNLTQPEHRFNATKARYVRITLTSYDNMGGERNNNMRPWPGIRELEIFN